MNSNFLNTSSQLTSPLGSGILTSNSAALNQSGASFYQGLDFDDLNGVNVFPFKLQSSLSFSSNQNEFVVIIHHPLNFTIVDGGGV